MRAESVVAGMAGLATVAGMIAIPLVPQGGRARRILSTVVVSGLFTSTTSHAARRWGIRRAGAAAASTAVATTLVERVGTATGVPFGRYAYSAALRPKIAGVPVIVPMAWFAMSLPSRETAHAALGARSTPATRVALGAAAMTAWDLFLDPQMVGEGYWAWARTGIYRGIPLTNFAGWFVTSLVVVAALESLLPVDPEPATDAAHRRLVGTYASVAVMETLGFARFFRDPVVAVVGGLAMVPIAVAAITKVARG